VFGIGTANQTKEAQSEHEVGNDHLVHHLRIVAASAGEGRLTRRRYEELRGPGSPSSITVIRKLGNGSWRAACRAAGLEPASESSSTALRAASASLGHPLSRWGYRQWRRTQDDPTAWPALEYCGIAQWIELCRCGGVEVAVGRPRQLISNEAIFKALDAAAASMARPPLSREAYSSWRARQKAMGAKRIPSAGTVLSRFGSWGKACAAAGLGTPHWDRLDLIKALRAAAGGSALTRTRYDAWVAAGHGRPAISTMQRQFGSWAKALEAAGVARRVRS
jgi:hypothetical protein